MSASLAGHPIVCLGFAEWDAELKTNQHHLMSRLAAGRPVLFIESLGLRRPTASARDVRRVVKRLRRGVRPLRRVGNVDVLSPLVLPYHGARPIRSLNRMVLRRTVRRAVRKLGFEHPLVLWAYVPQGEQLVDALKPDLVVYHCVDDIAAHDRIDTESFRAAEARLVREADLVIATSAPLHDRLRRQTDRVRLMPNVADTDVFAHALDENPQTDKAMEALGRPRIVFAGAISAIKVDFALVRDLAIANPAWSFALVGPVGLGDPDTDVSSLEAVPNIHLLGPRAYAELPRVLASADAAMIPYRLTELTSSIFPMKVYEYLAAGLPTVSTPLPALTSVDGIELASGAEAMGAALERLLRDDSRERRLLRSAQVQGHSWDERIKEIELALEGLEWRR